MDGNELHEIINDLRRASAIYTCSNIQLASLATEFLDLCYPPRFDEHHWSTFPTLSPSALSPLSSFSVSSGSSPNDASSPPS
ncbi:hypothetical protein LB505_003326 [Fusarium chuoi]|nr:hypothetical protein LB505_003326 [Fusarium chuoi]